MRHRIGKLQASLLCPIPKHLEQLGARSVSFNFEFELGEEPSAEHGLITGEAVSTGFVDLDPKTSFLLVKEHGSI